MKQSLVAIVFFTSLSAVYSEVLYNPDAPLGSAENPHPEHYESDHEGETSDAEDFESEQMYDPLSTYQDSDSGTLSEEDLRGLHAKLDKNGDGKVHMDEVMQHADEARKRIVKSEIADVMDEIDSTKDGHLTLEEHMSEVEEFMQGDEEEKEKQRAFEKAKFNAADANGDGKLDVNEIASFMHPNTHPEVLELHIKEEMRRWDTDKDSKLNKKEWLAAKKRGEYIDPDAHSPSDDFDKLDGNKDGLIDMNELRHWESGRFHMEVAMKELYQLADKNRDHHMTADEFVAAAEHFDGLDAHSHLVEWIHHDEM